MSTTESCFTKTTKQQHNNNVNIKKIINEPFSSCLWITMMSHKLVAKNTERRLVKRQNSARILKRETWEGKVWSLVLPIMCMPVMLHCVWILGQAFRGFSGVLLRSEDHNAECLVMWRWLEEATARQLNRERGHGFKRQQSSILSTHSFRFHGDLRTWANDWNVSD